MKTLHRPGSFKPRAPFFPCTLHPTLDSEISSTSHTTPSHNALGPKTPTSRLQVLGVLEWDFPWSPRRKRPPRILSSAAHPVMVYVWKPSHCRGIKPFWPIWAWGPPHLRIQHLERVLRARPDTAFRGRRHTRRAREHRRRLWRKSRLPRCAQPVQGGSRGADTRSHCTFGFF